MAQEKFSADVGWQTARALEIHRAWDAEIARGWHTQHLEWIGRDIIATSLAGESLAAGVILFRMAYEQHGCSLGLPDVRHN